MLTKEETAATRQELQENFTRLSRTKEAVARDLEISLENLEAVLAMKRPNPAHVWMLREYLEEQLLVEGKTVYPFTKLADPSVNHWYSYSRPWRES